MARAEKLNASGADPKEVIELRGIGENIDLAEVAEVYLPLSRLIHLQVAARQQLTAATETFLGTSPSISVPFVIGVAGSVAVGKSTTARLLQVLLQRWNSHPAWTSSPPTDSSIPARN